MSHEFRRADLYHLVWSEPLRTLAKRLGVSDVAVAKRCRQVGIPLPGLGYWAKKEAGKAVVQATLPPRALGQSDRITIGRVDAYGRAPSDGELIEMVLPNPPAFEDDLDAVRIRAAALASKVRPTSFRRLHPAVAAILEIDDVRRKKHAETGWSLDVPLFDDKNEKRRLRLLSSLLNALASCGYKCSAEPKDGYHLSVVIGDQRLRLSLAPSGFDSHKHYPGRLVPNNGSLSLRIEWYQPTAGIPTCWSDKDGLLGDRLPEVVAGLLVAAEWGYREGLSRRHSFLVEQKARAIEDRRRAEEEAAQKEREKVESEAKKRLDALLNDVTLWQRATEIRSFVRARTARGADDVGLREWARWALAEADRMDPLAGVQEG